METTVKNFFKSNLLFLLEKNNITAAQLSRELDVSKQAVSSWIKEDSNISVQHGIQVSKFFSVSLDDLFLYDLRASALVNNVSEIDIFSNSDVAFTAIDTWGIGNYSNPAMAELLQYNREELISRHSYELIHPFDMQRYRVEMLKLKGGEADFVSIDLKYLIGSGQFNWIRQFLINSPKDRRVYIFAFPYSDSLHQSVKLKKEKFFIENIAIQELESCKGQTFFKKTIEIMNSFEPDLWLNTDQSVFQCLIRSMFYQLLFIEIETESRVVKFNSRKDHSNVIITAIINCKVNAKPLSIKRLERIAKMVNATVEETHAGNIYCLSYTFHQQ